MTVTKERLIYTAGTFKITDELANCRRLVIRSSMLRKPNSARYWNERSNPIKYFFGYVSIFINDYVYTTIPLEFEQQIVLFWDNPEKQLYARMLCEFSNNTANLVALRTSIPLAGALLPLPGEPGSFSGCPYTNLKFKLEFGARILVTAAGDETEVCDDAPFDTKLPSLDPPPPPYPDDQARDEDPPRSTPEEGELPDDTAPVTPQDPEAETPPPVPCVTVIHGRGVNTDNCTPKDNLGDYSYNGYGTLVAITYLGCSALRLYLDGVDTGIENTFYPDAVVASRTGDCTPP